MIQAACVVSDIQRGLKEKWNPVRFIFNLVMWIYFFLTKMDFYHVMTGMLVAQSTGIWKAWVATRNDTCL